MIEKINNLFWLVLLFILGSASILFILPSFWSRFFFFLLVLAVIGWTAKESSKTDVNTLALITGYVLSIGQWGLHFYFNWSAWFMMLIAFGWIFALFWLGFKLKFTKISASGKIMSLTAALTGSQIMLALLFWPTHFLVTGTVFFLLFYLVWMIINFYMAGLLNWHRTMIHAIFVGVVLMIVLFTAQWTI